MGAEEKRFLAAIRTPGFIGDRLLIEIIRDALLAANEDLYGDEGNSKALAALDELKSRLDKK